MKKVIKNTKNEIICDSKLSFTTVDAVLSHIKNLNKEGILSYYQCNVCGNFHTTTLPGKNKVSEKREKMRQKRLVTKNGNRIKKFKKHGIFKSRTIWRYVKEGKK